MQLPAWVREKLWRAEAWCTELAQLRKALAAEPRTARTIERTYELAGATEYIDPDRGRALQLYLEAWRAGHPAAGERAASLARELRAHVTLAELATVDGDLLVAGCAFIDAGLVELAAAPLGKVTDPRHAADVKPLLAIARGQRVDSDKEIAACLARAQAAGDPALYIQAARLSRRAGIDPVSILATATRRYPKDRGLEALVEERLLQRGNADELLDHYRRRCEAAGGEAAWVASMRDAACTLVVRDIHPGLGLRLLRVSLEHAYQAMIPEIPQHLAAWELLVTNARLARTTPDLVPLVVDAIGAPLSEDDAVYLSRLGLEITWRDAGNPTAAQPYAAALIEFVPDHPLAVEFVREVPDAVPAPPPPAPPPPAPAPITQTTKIAVAPPPEPVAATPVPVAPAPPSRAALLGKSGPLPMLRRATRRSVVPPVNIGAPRAPRAVVPVDVVIELANGNFFSTVLRDLSTTGAFIITKRALEVGSIVTLEMRIPNPEPMQQSNHRVNATIARRTELGCGLAFVGASPALIAAIAAIAG